MPKYRAWDKVIGKMIYDGDTVMWSNVPHPNVRVTNLGLVYDVNNASNDYVRVYKNGKSEDFYSSWDYTILTNNHLILMQSTSLLDSHGTEIFEGDIVKHTRTNWYCLGHPSHNTDLVDNNEIYRDEKYPGALRCRTIDLSRKNQPPYSGSGYLSFKDSRADKNIIEIIGSIHANPELLGDPK